MGNEVDKFTGRVLNGTFVVDERIGEGGMGTVYAAHNAKTPGIRYAVKVLRADGLATDDEAGRFRREAQALAALDHPAIVRPVHADLTPEGEPYLVMELLRGASLREEITNAQRTGTHVALPLVVSVLDAIADALDHAHSRGIAHRDLKPENVMVLGAGRTVLVKVLDFGIAKIFRPDGKPVDTITQAREVAGTVSYMSPEQCRDLRSAGAAGDRFALGVMAYELLTTRRPFDDSNAASTICNILLNPIPAVTALRPDLPSDLDAVIARACAKDPDARFPTGQAFVTALADALGPALTSGPISLTTRPPPIRSVPAPPEEDHDAIATSDTMVAPVRSLHTPSPSPSQSQSQPRRVSPMGVVAIVGAAAAATSGAVLAASSWGHHAGGNGVRTHDAGSAVVTAAACGGRVREATAGLYDDEVCIPGGAFRMGTPEGEGEHDEEPARRVTLAPFYADRYEVTVARYRRCVTAGGCDPRGTDAEGPYNDAGDYAARGTRFRPSARCTYRAAASTNDTRPVNCLSHAQGEQLCRFEGRRLLTEAEWERLARGAGERPRVYPWGDSQPDCNRASFGYGAGCGLAEPVPVGTARAGATPEGVYDLAGNVAEWTADWYSADYYATAPDADPPGATLDDSRARGGDALICQDGCRATRGGTWVTPLGMVGFLRGAHRTADAPNRRATTLGVRCARTP